MSVAVLDGYGPIGSDEFDIAYLLAISDDAVGAIIDHLDDLGPHDRAGTVAALCSAPIRSTSGLDWNWSVSSARSVIDKIC